MLSTAWSVMLSGLLFGGIFVYLPPMNIESMTSDTVYWLTIAAFIIGSVMVILPFTKTASILSCALIGTFIFIVPIGKNEYELSPKNVGLVCAKYWLSLFLENDSCVRPKRCSGLVRPVLA